MSTKKILWTPEKESFLIDLIREKRPLWNQTDENFNKKSVKKVLYDVVAQEMAVRWPEEAATFSGTLVHTKFNSLKSYFHKEERKRMSIEGIDVISRWVHYHQLYFLKLSSGPSESTLDLAAEDNSQNLAAPKDQPSAFENGLRLQETFIIKEEPSSSEMESTPSLPLNCEPPSEKRKNIQGEETVSLATSSLPNVVESSSSDMESIPSELTSREPPKKKRKRKNLGEEIFSLATSALKNIETLHDKDSSSVSYAMGYLVQTTLRNLSPVKSSEFTQELITLIAKYTKYINCSR